MERQSRKILTGTITGYLSTGRMVPPRTSAQRKTYYREAVRLSRAAGSRFREFRRSLRDAFPPAGRLGVVQSLGPMTFHLGGCDYEVESVSMTWEGRGRRSRPVFVTNGSAKATWPVT